MAMMMMMMMVDNGDEEDVDEEEGDDDDGGHFLGNLSFLMMRTITITMNRPSVYDQASTCTSLTAPPIADFAISKPISGNRPGVYV